MGSDVNTPLRIIMYPLYQFPHRSLTSAVTTFSSWTNTLIIKRMQTLPQGQRYVESALVHTHLLTHLMYWEKVRKCAHFGTRFVERLSVTMLSSYQRASFVAVSRSKYRNQGTFVTEIFTWWKEISNSRSILWVRLSKISHKLLDSEYNLIRLIQCGNKLIGYEKMLHTVTAV